MCCTHSGVDSSSESSGQSVSVGEGVWCGDWQNSSPDLYAIKKVSYRILNIVFFKIIFIPAILNMIHIIWSITFYVYTSLQYNFIEQLGLILTIFDWMLVFYFIFLHQYSFHKHFLHFLSFYWIFSLTFRSIFYSH